MTGRARKLSAAERSRREFQEYRMPLKCLFRCLSRKCLFLAEYLFLREGSPRGGGGLRIAPWRRGSADFHFWPWSNGKAMNLVPLGVQK